MHQSRMMCAGIEKEVEGLSREHLQAENERLHKLEESLRAHLSRTINRAEKAEKELAEQEADRTPDRQS